MNGPLRRGKSGTIALISLMIAGCGPGKPAVSTSHTEATVSGTVKVRGKLVKKGQVVFNPANYLRKDVAAIEAPIKADGTYEITTLVGGNTVSLIVDEIRKDPNLMSAKIPFDAKAGANTFDIELPPPPAPAAAP